jgi:hypothetical protein
MLLPFVVMFFLVFWSVLIPATVHACYAARAAMGKVAPRTARAFARTPALASAI